MAQEYSRTRRVADQIQKELAVLIQQQLRDPRVGFTTVSAVEVSKDLSHARVYVTSLPMPEGEPLDDKVLLSVLNKASGFLRRMLAPRMQLRIVPELRFFYDQSLKRGNYLDDLINKAIAKDNL